MIEREQRKESQDSDSKREKKLKNFFDKITKEIVDSLGEDFAGLELMVSEVIFEEVKKFFDLKDPSLFSNLNEWKKGFLLEKGTDLKRKIFLEELCRAKGLEREKVDKMLWDFFEENPLPLSREGQRQWKHLLEATFEEYKKDLVVDGGVFEPQKLR